MNTYEIDIKGVRVLKAAYSLANQLKKNKKLDALEKKLVETVDSYIEREQVRK